MLGTNKLPTDTLILQKAFIILLLVFKQNSLVRVSRRVEEKQQFR